MRHTLLPTQERKDIHREYYIRLMIVTSCMVSIALITGSVLLMPAYLGAKAEEGRQLDSITKLKDDSGRKSDTSIVSELSFDSKAIDILEKSLLEERSSEAIERIIALRQEIHLSSISYSITGTTSAEVILQGVAPTRASLLSFKGRLEGLAPGTRIDLPLVELAKSSDIPFSLKFIYKRL